MEKELFQSYDNSKEKKELYVSLLETICGAIPINFTLKLIEEHQKTTLFNKLYSFYLNTRDMEAEQHQKIIAKLQSNKDFRRNTAELLLELIDKTITDANIDLLCNLYKNTAEDRISEADFIRLSITLQKCTYTDLLSLTNYYRKDVNFNGIYEGSSTDALNAAGLLYKHIIGSPILYKINNLGFDLLKFGINADV